VIANPVVSLSDRLLTLWVSHYGVKTPYHSFTNPCYKRTIH
jgi:hypothetical protein